MPLKRFCVEVLYIFSASIPSVGQTPSPGHCLTSVGWEWILLSCGGSASHQAVERMHCALTGVPQTTAAVGCGENPLLCEGDWPLYIEREDGVVVESLGF